ncbi:putative maltose permease (MalP) [Penicillium cataractarum]|uniref:Maltose permease (MalP) n=1 Tax=Penicillium cataractarum TaxID=2100454 RepID=A0A9W9VU28_9EURO|nr:putative maltose permease (MalP) [Penicillium cataractarum]KAJ5389244.1 putative maltose permease (MalP) [Penicillium cataractarum]
MASVHSKFDAEHRDHVEQVFKPDDTAADAAAMGQATSGYESLSLWQTAKMFKVATITCFAAAFSAATDGYQIGMNGSIIANQGFVKQFATDVTAKGTPYLGSPVLAGWSSIMSVGQIIGMVTIPFISRRFGRKIAMYTYWLILTASVLAESLARSWPVWLIAKLLAGIGVGCLQSTLPVYISECAPVRIRGGLLMCYSLWWTIGSFFAYIALQTLSKQSPTTWLTPVYTQWIQIGIMIIIYVFLPESPAWCATRGDGERAKRELLKLNRGVKDYNLEQQYELLVLTVEHEKQVAEEQKSQHWYAIFRGTDGLRTAISLWPNLTQQFIGLTLFATFGTYFFQQAGLSDPFKIKCITSAINITTLLTVVLVSDRIGRRKIACYATSTTWTCCVVIGILGLVPQTTVSKNLFVLFVCLWNVGQVSNGAAGWGYIAETSALRLRPHTAGFGAAVSCVAGVVMNVLTPYMVNANKWNWGFKTGWFYAGVGLPFLIGTWLLLPETKGRSAAELDELFERKIKPIHFAKTETATQRLVRANDNV